MNDSSFNIKDFEKLLRKNIMSVNIVQEISKPIIKINEVQDYYNFFVSMLRTEDALLYNMEHLWILGIDDKGYSRCAYLIDYSKKLDFDYDTRQLFATSLTHGCNKIVLAYYKNSEIIDITNQDIFFASSVFLKGFFIGMDLYDYIIISSKHDNIIDPKKLPDSKSLLEANLMESVVCKHALDIKKLEYAEELKKESFYEGIEEGELNKTIEIARNLLSNNVDIKIITASTGLTAKQIEQIKLKS